MSEQQSQALLEVVNKLPLRVTLGFLLVGAFYAGSKWYEVNETGKRMDRIEAHMVFLDNAIMSIGGALGVKVEKPKDIP